MLHDNIICCIQKGEGSNNVVSTYAQSYYMYFIIEIKYVKTKPFLTYWWTKQVFGNLPKALK